MVTDGLLIAFSLVIGDVVPNNGRVLVALNGTVAVTGGVVANSGRVLVVLNGTVVVTGGVVPNSGRVPIVVNGAAVVIGDGTEKVFSLVIVGGDVKIGVDAI